MMRISPLFVGICCLFLCACVSGDLNFGIEIPYPVIHLSDYIIVGAGVGGSVVATRLAQSGKLTLLIEAGGPSHTELGGRDFVAANYRKNADGTVTHLPSWTRYDVPAFGRSAVPATAGTPEISYPVRTIYGLATPHSKILGGNGVHNNMVWTRNTQWAQDGWGVTGWGYNDVLPYHKKLENVTGTYLQNNPTYHGTTGPVKLNFVAPGGNDQAGPAFVQACLNAGYPNDTDFNDNIRYGCGYHAFNIDDRGVRASSALAYLPLVLGKPNFRLLLNALVTKVLFTPSKIAYGVTLTIGDQNYTALALREVILSLGSINTPKLLMLSGVGLPAILDPLGIPVVSNLPVGTKMLSHADVTVQYSYPQYDFPGVWDISGPANVYAQTGTGPLASAGFFGAAFLKTNPNYTDGNLHLGTVLVAGKPRVIGAQLTNQRPERVLGVLNISSTDINAAPYLYLTAWDSQNNVDDAVIAIKIIRGIFATAPSGQYFGAEILPGPNVTTDAQLQAYVRSQQSGTNLTHLWGGAILGNTTDTTSVLDPRARVKGVTGLRVSDLSIVPNICEGHPNINVMMFSEKIADMIIQDNS